jgi:hypothetical protein
MYMYMCVYVYQNHNHYTASSPSSHKLPPLLFNLFDPFPHLTHRDIVALVALIFQQQEMLRTTKQLGMGQNPGTPDEPQNSW